MEENNSQVIFDKNAVEFVTVAAEFCGFMERVSDMKRRDLSTILANSYLFYT